MRLAADGATARSIAREVGIEPGVVSIWRHRFADHGLEALNDQPRVGKPATYPAEPDKRILKVLDEPPPAGCARGTSQLIWARLGDVREQYVWRVLCQQNMDLADRKSWCESNDPEFAAKEVDVAGLSYMAPTENVVICVEENPSIQALERARRELLG